MSDYREPTGREVWIIDGNHNVLKAKEYRKPVILRDDYIYCDDAGTRLIQFGVYDSEDKAKLHLLNRLKQYHSDNLEELAEAQATIKTLQGKMPMLEQQIADLEVELAVAKEMGNE